MTSDPTPRPRALAERPDPQDMSTPAALGARQATVVGALVDALLAAHRDVSLAELMLRRPAAAQRLARRFLGSLTEDVDDPSIARDGSERLTECAKLFIRWLCGALRPDGLALESEIGTAEWLYRTSWRPFLALVCHHGLLVIPVFAGRHARRPQESAADTLCGLWGVGTSTFYRYLDKGRRQALDLTLSLRSDPVRRLSLRESWSSAIRERLGRDDAWQAWHVDRMEAAVARHDAVAAFWHALHGMRRGAAGQMASRFHAELAASRDWDALSAQAVARQPGREDRFHLVLASASVARAQHADARAESLFLEALQIAGALDDPAALGSAYLAMGRFYETRDPDRARACLEDAAEFLRRAVEERRHDVVDEQTVCLQHTTAWVLLAWSLAMRNDPRARLVLERVEGLSPAGTLPPEMLGLIHQAWGEYWRRAGQPQSAIREWLRALNLFDRLGQTRQILTVCNNLCIVYGETREFDRAVDYGTRVIDMAARVEVEAYILAGTRINLGAAHFWRGDMNQAQTNYQAALEIARRAGLRLVEMRAVFNLAECHYKRFQLSADGREEALGDAYAALVLQAPTSDVDSFLKDATRTLKEDVLGPQDGARYQRLVPQELAEHPTEMQEIQELRARLALPLPPEEKVSCHLDVAAIYRRIADEEVRRALEIASRHGLSDRFEAFRMPPPAQAPATGESCATTVQQDVALLRTWARTASDIVAAALHERLLERLQAHGFVSKSTYAELCNVGPATASKHLGMLAERGLVVQAGRGPSTRYVLPAKDAAL